MTIKLIAVDLDGTLLTSSHEVSPGVLTAVRAAQARGVRVVVATGRIWPSAAPYVQRVGADPPVILYNGGLVYDFRTNTFLHRVTLAYDHARAVLELLRQYPQVQPHLCIDDRVYIGHANALSDGYARKNGITLIEVGDLVKFLPPDPMKILIVGARPDLVALKGAIESLSMGIHTVFSELTYLEILPVGISKGTALAFVAQHLAIPRAAVLAVGDNLNDLEMIQFAGVGVAMANAEAALIPQAGFVTGTNDEDGVRDVIERFVLSDARKTRM